MAGQIENILSKESIAAFAELRKNVDLSVASLEALVSKAVEFNAAISQGNGGYKKFKDELKGVENNQKDLIRSMREYLNLSKQLKNAMDDPRTASAAAKAARDLANAEKAQAQARKENAAAAERESRATNTANKSTKEAERSAQQAAKAKAAEAKLIDQATNEYLQLSKAYNEAALKAKNYALTLGESHPVTEQAFKDAKSMYDILLRLDQRVGQNGRAVGDYKRAFDGLGMSFTQVSRELPSLTISAQQFVLAISNNLPMVFDEIAKARTEIAALKAEGKDTPSLLQRIGGAVLSWQVGLSVGIALLTAYSGKLVEWIKTLFDSSSALKEAAKQQQFLNKERLKAIETEQNYLNTTKSTSGTIVRNLENELARARARGDSEEKILNMERELLKVRQQIANVDFFGGDKILGVTPEPQGLERLELLRKDYEDAEQALKDFYKTRQAFGDVLEPDSKEYSARETQLQDRFKFTEKLYADQKDIVEEYFNVNRDLQLKDLELQKFYMDNRIKFFADELQYRADNLKELSSIEELGYQQRIEARKQAYALEKLVLEGQRKDELIDAKGNRNKIFEINRDYNFQEKVLAEEFGKDLLTIRQSFDARLSNARAAQRAEDAEVTKMFYDEQAKSLKDRLDKEEKDLLRRKYYLEEGRDILIRSLEDEKAAKLAAAQTDEQRQLIEERYNRKRLQVEIDTNRQILAEALAAAEQKLKRISDPTEYAALKATIAELKRQLAELKNQKIDIDTDQAKEKIEDLIKGFEKYRTLANGLFTSIFEVGQIGFDKRKAEIDEETALIDQRYQNEIAGIKASGLSQQEKTQKLQEAEILYNAQKRQQELKQKQVERDRAKFERAISIQRIVSDTASAIMNQLRTTPLPAGLPFIAAIGAIGAAQLARVIATPLPAYAHGTDSAAGGLSVVGDGGRQELVQQPDGTTWLTPNRPTVMNVPKGSIVYPDARKVMESTVAAKLAVNSSGQLIEVNKVSTAGIERRLDKLTKAVQNKRELKLNANESGMSAIWKYGANTIKYIEDQTNW